MLLVLELLVPELLVFVELDELLDVVLLDELLLEDVPPVSRVGVELVVDPLGCVPLVDERSVRLSSIAAVLPAVLPCTVPGWCAAENELMKLMIVNASIDVTWESMFTSNIAELAVGVRPRSECEPLALMLLITVKTSLAAIRPR